MDSSSITSAFLRTLLASLTTNALVHAQCEEHRVAAPDAADFDDFGSAVDVDGTRVIVGSPFHDRGEVSDAGAAYVFDFGANGWELDDQIDLNNASGNDQFGGAVAVEGDLALIGASWRDFGGFPNTGVVYVYERAAQIWAQSQTLAPSDASSGDFFGAHIDLRGNRAVVSSYRAGPATAWVYEKVGGLWQEIAVLQVGSATYDVTAIAIDGSTVMIGVGGHEDGSGHEGAVFVFEETGGVWSQVSMLRPDTGLVVSAFGNSISLEGERALIGCPTCYTDIGFSPGAAFVYERSAGSWNLAGEIQGSSPENGNRFGHAVALEDEYALVGAPRAGPPTDTGRAYLFRNDGGTWSETARLDPPDPGYYDYYGQAVALRDKVAAIARPWFGNPGIRTGEVTMMGLGGAANRCTSVANSTGVPSTISHQGSVSVTTNNLRLVASDLPPNQFGIFYYGASPAELPFGDGYRCVGGQIFRFSPQSTQDGGVTRLLDLGNPPGQDGRIESGSTWHFQFWFRDPAAGGSGWNLSDALEILFCL